MAGLDLAQKSAYMQAREAASPENGSQWKEARQILEKAGFSVYKLYAVGSEAIWESNAKSELQFASFS